MTPLLLAALLFVAPPEAPALSRLHAPTLLRQDWMRPVDNPRTETLWPDGAPGKVGDEDQDTPTLTIYLPAKPQATGVGIVICPGGGYRGLAMDHEGHQVARWLTSRGIAAFIVKYRLGPRYHHPAMLQDVLRAIRVVRSRADEFDIDPQRLGVMGFSAGGHLASSAATLYDHPDGRVTDGLNATSSRPDFAILAYPVIVFGQDVTHSGSQENLLGTSPSPALVAQMSTERQVTADTPPTFLFHTSEDEAVPVENSVQFYLALKKAGVPAELHIYEKGAHGVGLAPHDVVLSTWPDRALAWLRARGLLDER
jgi:acetyl esterase/lipase